MSFCHYPQAPGTDLFTVSKVLPFLECHAVGNHRIYLGFVVLVPSRNNAHLRLSVSRCFPIWWVTDSILTFHLALSQGSAIVPCTTSPAKDQSENSKYSFCWDTLHVAFSRLKSRRRRVWWLTPLLPALGRQKRAELCSRPTQSSKQVPEHPG